jgi:hypothetical protein
MYKVITLRPHCKSLLSHQPLHRQKHASYSISTPIMMSFLHTSKATILNLLKSLPATQIAEEKDFEVWGCQFVDTVVNQGHIGGVDMAN